MNLLAVLTTLALAAGVNCESVGQDEYPVVQTSSGPIMGVKKTSSWTNQSFYAFLGVPYAAPPVDNLRFQDPQSPQNWTTELNCTEEQASCYQPSDMFSNTVTSVAGMSEDCLYLNVYTPQVNSSSEAALLPVVVWVHGGAFICGSGNYSAAGFDYFIAEGIVVVTLNYRLGSFGFMSLGSAVAAGNYGLKDQRFALLWVQSEIKKFGGDPTQVTLFGESSGSASVHLHYLSPLSVGLFNRTIADSGTGLVAWAVREDAATYGLQLATLLGCNTTNLTETVACMRAVDAVTLLDAQVQVKVAEKDKTGLLDLEFTPGVDSWSAEPFLPETPYTLMTAGQGSAVPFMMGTNRDEGVLDLFFGESAISNVTNELEKFIPVYVKENCTSARKKYLAELIDEFYLNNKTPNYTNVQGFLKLNTDAWFSYSTAVSARYFQTRADVYLYLFMYDGSFKQTAFEELEAALNITLVSHAEEMNYLTIVDGVNQITTVNSTEDITRKRMVTMWTNFIKYGVPANGSDSVLGDLEWLPVNSSSTRHLVIDTDLTMNHSNYLAERVAFWDTLTASSASPLAASILSIVATLVMVLFT